MPLTVSNVDVLHDYLAGVMSRSEHHAGDVGAICLAIAGAVVWRMDGEIEVFERDGEAKNAHWVPINGKRYAISYNHDTHKIDIREKSLKGQTIASFDNRSTAKEVKSFFAEL